LAGDADGLGGDVRCEDLEFDRSLERTRNLVEDHRDRVGLFAARGGRDPSAKRTRLVVPSFEALFQLVAQGLEALRVSEEARDADEQLLKEGVELPRLLGQELDVVLEVALVVDQRASFDAAADRALLELAEVDALVAVEVVEQSIVGRAWLFRLDAVVLFGRRDGRRATEQDRQLPGDALGAQAGVDEAGAQRAVRHPVELGGLGVLREHDAAELLDVADTAGAVAA
jgi:hypothetical protein